MSLDVDLDQVIILTIKYQKETFQIDVPDCSLISDLRSKLEGYTGLQPSEMRLIFKGRILQDTDPVSALNEDDQILVVKLTQAPSPGQKQPGQSVAPSSSFSNMVSSMFKSQGLKVKSLFGRSDDPNLQSVLEKNPELRHIMNDPSIVKDTIEAMQNPSLQREMMRNQDLALSNIEMLPEGFNALSRSYKTIQKPLLDAVDESTRVKFDNAKLADTKESKRQINKEPLPNPWKASNPTSGRPAAVPAAPVSEGSMGQLQNQLKELQDMGFTDEQENMRALLESNGDIDLAVDRILSFRSKE